jgi:hypothetical protein
MKQISHKLSNVNSFACFILIACSHASALDLSGSLSLSTEHTDNSLRTDINKQSDLQTTVGATINLQEETKTILANIDYDIEYNHFNKSTQENDKVINGLGTVTWSPIPQTFQWDFLGSSRNLQRDRREADTLNNREQRNFYSTGPTGIIRLSKIDQLVISALYSATRLDTTDNSNNDRSTGNLTWQHRLSNTQNISVGAQYIDVNFSDNNQENIKTTSGYVGFQSQTRESALRLSAGVNKSEIDNRSSINGTLFEAFYSQTHASHELSFLAIHQLTDSVTGLQANIGVLENGINIEDSNFDTIDIVERSFAQIAYNNNSTPCNNCSFGIIYTFDKQNFDEQPRDETNQSIAIITSYQSSSRLNTSLRYIIEKITFEDDNNREDTLQTTRLSIDYNLLENTRLSLFTDYRKRSSDTPLIEFTEWSGGVSINYQFR